jgi:peptide/nickel transport system substrate-binding protein
MSARRRTVLQRSLALATLGPLTGSALLAACGPSGGAGTGQEAGSAGTSGSAGTAPQSGTGKDAGQPKPGGTLRIAAYQEPTILNPYLNSQTIGSEVFDQLIQGLILVDPDGNYIPWLATEVPSVQNGGVSADGKTVTYKLRPGVTWHDGKPFTAKDVVFTWQAVMDPTNPVVTRTGFKDIEAVEAKDDATAVVRFKELYAPYLTLFTRILPAHVFGGQTAMEKHEYGRKPIGTGPFKFVEWVSGDHITLARHPDYWRKGQPYLDQVIFRITPSREVSVAQLKTGEVDVVWDMIEAQVPEFEGNPEIDVWAFPGVGVERLILNLSAPSGPGQGNPDVKHPILGDPKVREAIELAINKKVLVDKLLYGKTTVGTSPLPSGWAAPKLTPSEFSPDKAKRLLDEAGWKPGPDGIRAKDGVKMQMTFSTTSGNNLRELTQQVMQEQLQAVGIALEIKNMPSAVLLGTWADNSPRSKGQFDVNMWTTNAGVDPHSHLFAYFHSSQIPAEANKGEGQNYARLKSDVVDKALEEAGATPDQTKRKAAYERAIKAIVEARGHIFLYNRLDVDGARKYVKGHKNNPWWQLTWDVENWWLAK